MLGPVSMDTPKPLPPGEVCHNSLTRMIHYESLKFPHMIHYDTPTFAHMIYDYTCAGFGPITKSTGSHSSI